MIQHLSEAEKVFLKKFANIIVTPGGNTWYYMPLWFKMDKDGVFESFSFERLPEELKIQVRNMRDGKRRL